VRATILAAGGLACAGAAMTIAAFAGGGSSSENDPDPASRAAVSTAAAAAGAERGKQVFLEQGCGSCHVFEPAGTSGPIGPDFGRSLQGKSRDYVLESVVLPNEAAAESFTVGGMPDDYAQRIAPGDLDPLVDFLMQGAG
jgi:mono/diheme cytochrome c family protein